MLAIFANTLHRIETNKWQSDTAMDTFDPSVTLDCNIKDNPHPPLLILPFVFGDS
jgi:hypothetical protein